MKAVHLPFTLEFSPALTATITPDERARLLPVEFEPMDALAEPEPSIGTLIELENGQLAAIVYGELTNTLTIELPHGSDPATHLMELLREVPIDTDAITWINPRVVRLIGR